MKPVFLHSLAMLTALGDTQSTLDGLRALSTAGLNWRTDLRTTPARVAQVQVLLPDSGDWPLQFQSRNNQLLAATLKQIESEVAAIIDRHGADRVGAVIGSSTSGILEGGAALKARLQEGKFPASFTYAQQEIGAPSVFLREMTGIRGPHFTVSTACTSGAKALAAAARLVRAGICDAVIAGGVDSLCPLTVSGFSSLESVAADRSNPFSRNRDGITIGEGAALFIVSREPGPVRLAGFGETSDAHHISAPDPEGLGAERALHDALKLAQIRTTDIGYINLHGTATAKNDLMESHVVHRIFGDAVPTSSTKPLLGHTLGAAGAIEAGVCWQLLQEGGQLPPHAWDGEHDPALAPVQLCDTQSVNKATRYMLSNSFAFGGSNAVLVIGKE